MQIESYYNIEKEVIIEDGIHNLKQFISIKNKKGVFEKIYIPNKPDFINRDEIRKLFIDGITKSLYFIN